jgi:hypothetical protein
MKTSTQTTSAAILAGLAFSVLACTGRPPLPSSPTNGQVPFDAVVLAPNEKITLNARTAKQRQYFCSNGTVLQCERFGQRLHCSCPGSLVH